MHTDLAVKRLGTQLIIPGGLSSCFTHYVCFECWVSRVTELVTMVVCSLRLLGTTTENSVPAVCHGIEMSPESRCDLSCVERASVLVC